MFTINSIVDMRKNRIDLEPGLEFNCVSNDSGASYKIIFNFKQSINTEKISGVLNFLMPDKVTEYVDNIIFENECTAYYKLKDNLLLQSGRIEVALTLLDDNRFTVYNTFVINVKKQLIENEQDIPPDEPTYILLKTLLEEVKNLETSVQSNESIRITNENLRIKAEDSREEAEKIRKLAELDRIDNEYTRNKKWLELQQKIAEALANVHDGLDAKINGYNTIEIKGGNGIKVEQKDNTLTINGLDWETI